VLVPWQENQATWNTRLSQIPWNAPGALNPSDTAQPASSSVVVSGLGTYTIPSSPQLVADVQGWLDNPAGNHGWLLRSQSENVLRTARHFASREALDPATRPRLRVTYVTRPLLAGVEREGDGVAFEFSAEAGVSYRIETRTSLVTGNWELRRRVGPLAETRMERAVEPLPTGSQSLFVRVVAE
jgi:hypothetical protein